MTHDPDRIQELFDHAAGLPVGEVSGYLDEACGDDTALREEIESLLANMGDDDTLKELPGGNRGDRLPGEYIAGDAIGVFTVRECIGSGGMGAVYLAQQTSPVRRQVALKVIKAGMDTRNTLARFQAERQALSMMDHPGIARVLEAGSTDTGRPWFAMEYIKGIDLNEYCERNRLDTTQRLELFTQVCDAVQHAHQKGVIHRDLKPSNILVTRNDQDQPQAKIIDFGIAKAMSSPLTEMTLHTTMGQVIGTLAYMSPEQVDGSVDVDTRTDVYSLGAILYELLTGRVPFDTQGDHESMKRSIREDDPPKPSTKLTSLTGEEAVRLAKAHRTDLVNLGRKLRKELEWIPLKALRKDRAERYSSPESLGEDVQRYLDGEPLEAAPLTRAYRMNKFIRRHRGPVLTAAGFVMLLIAATVVALTLWFEADAAMYEAELERQNADVARDQAEQERRKAEENLQAAQIAKKFGEEQESMFKKALSDADAMQIEFKMNQDQAEAAARFLENMFTSSASRLDMDSNLPPAMRAEALLVRARHAVGSEFNGNPIMEARVRATIANFFIAIEAYDDAEREWAQVLNIRIREQGKDHVRTLDAFNSMGRLLLVQGKYDESRMFYIEVLDSRRRILGDAHPDTVHSINDLVELHEDWGRPGDAAKYRAMLPEVELPAGEPANAAP